MSHFQVTSDFDGTISQKDSLKSLFDYFIGPKWRHLDEKIKSKAMSERVALQKMLDLCDFAFQDALNFILNEISIDPGFADFVAYCRREGIPLMILSSGFTEFILPLLRREGLGDLPVYANSLDQNEDGRWVVIERQSQRLCQTQSHCKCASFKRLSLGLKSVYIGDGHSDVCVAKTADIIFAKDFLKTSLDREAYVSLPWDNFQDICAQMESLRKDIPAQSEALSG